MAYWCADPVQSKGSISEILSIPFALVHEDSTPIFDAFDFSQREVYFRLICTKPLKPSLPPGFKFEVVDPSVETPAVAQIIKDCYQDMHVSDEIVRSWLDYPVYDPRSWMWIVEIATGKKVGLGIAEINRKVPEASLEWIQVLPNYRRLGIGTALVRELCMRVWPEVDFITVSGKVHSDSQPEKLYRCCGFTGSDVWWLLVA
jgi:GNAT superfamily N-acetyltransferase